MDQPATISALGSQKVKRGVKALRRVDLGVRRADPGGRLLPGFLIHAKRRP
jgi:hypothetical protein